jgi:DNA-binding transcriptional LysR family regulator
MRLTLEALAVVDAIERRGSFAAAAEELHRVPSAITYQVHKLEEDLGAALFDRSGHRATLTAAGRELLEAGRPLLAGADALERRVRRVATGWEADLRVVVDALVPWTSIWPLAAAFYADCERQGVPATRLKLGREVLGGVWDALAEGRADLAVGATGDAPGPGYRTRPLAEVTMVFAVAPGHPLAQASEPIAAEVVRRHRVVVAADSSRRLPARTVGLLGGQETLTVADLDAKIAAQAAGLGCGFVPVHLAHQLIASGRLVVKKVEESLGTPARMLLAWRTEHPGNAQSWWIDALQRSPLAERLSFGATLARDRSDAVDTGKRRPATRRRAKLGTAR